MPKHHYDDDDDDLLMALQRMEPCGNCGAEGATIPCMSGCGEVFYCSRECNMHHASAHRLRCRNLRCSKFNDSDSESGSDSYEEFTDDDSDEYETDDGEDDEEEEEEEVKPKKKSGGGGKKKQKSKRKMTRGDSVDAASAGPGGARIMMDSEVERRIEEKILRRLKKQEENRIAQAIEQRMREEKANWRDDEMNRIIMEMRERFQNEISNSAFMAQFIKKNGVHLDAQNSSDMILSIQAAAAAAAAQASPSGATVANPQAEEKGYHAAGQYDASTTSDPYGGTPMAVGDMGRDGRTQSVSKESSWNNACPSFLALRVVVWKHSFLPRMTFTAHPHTGIWNAIQQIDGDESFSHIAEGDALLSVNGRNIDDSVQTQQDLEDIFAAFASPLILKFEAAQYDSDKVHDYTVTWSNGPLGVTLKDDCSSQKVPIVNRLTKKAGSVAVKQNIAIGDILVAINNIDTIQLGCSLSMSILKKVQLPAKLRFRGVGGPKPGSVVEDDDGDDGKLESGLTSSMSRPAKYVVNWGEGPLGLTIIPGMDETDLPVIKKVTGTGTSSGIEKAQVGDVLESMNDISTAGMAFEDVVAYLKSAPKPVMLQFRSTVGDEGSSPPLTIEVSRPPSNDYVAPRPSPPRPESSLPTPPKPVTPPPQPVVPPSAPSPSRIIQDEIRDNYSIVWGDGPLGLTIDAITETGAGGAYIKRIAAQGAASRLSQDCIGDYLTHINDMDVTRIQFQDIVAHLKNAPRPLTLFFRRRTGSEKRHLSSSSSSISSVSSSSGAAPQGRMTDTPTRGRKPSAHEENGIYYYNVVWQEGTPLGLSLRSADNTSDYPYITRVTGAGSAAHLPNSVVGDCLISVDGRSVHMRDKTFDEVMTMLKNMPKPITLKFQSRKDEQRGGSSANMQVPPMPTMQKQQSYTWRQNRGGAYENGPPAPAPPYQSTSLPNAGTNPLASSGIRPNGTLSRSFVTASDRPLDSGAASEEKFASIQAPFLVQNKLSTGRRQKMLKGLKK